MAIVTIMVKEWLDYRVPDEVARRGPEVIREYLVANRVDVIDSEVVSERITEVEFDEWGV